MSLDTIFTVYYAFYFIFSISAQLFVLFLIIFHSPSNLKDMKKLMMATSTSQIIMCLSAFLTQVRIVPIDSSIALLSFGSCTLLGHQACLATYNMLNTSGCLVVASLLHMMFYRRRLLTTLKKFSNGQFFFNCVIVYFLSAIVLIFSFLGPTDFEFIRALVITNYPYIDLNSYTLSGFSNVKHFFCSTATGIIAAHAYIPPFVALIWRGKIVSEINSQRLSLSSRTQLQTRNFVKCLTFQTCLPLFFYVLPYTFYLIQQIFGIGFTITEYLIFPLNTFSAVLDPIFMLYFIKPYQRKAKIIISEMFGLSNLGNSSTVATVNSNTSQV
ncbi:Protein CBR-SRD-72 [Caenorhabditis briggsae]|uniref:Protein CBR-SRD-72 n=1 Tax=Caenorhabditis briggsae TaxID=6238 RepID=A8WPL9_CAEBR|nr:Protein CBR-SRD-72 [Caenorhabditis briggsae]CAP22426.1 Protein CBR-SRD-72 [Caenorhabditis briggsae]